MAYTPPAYNAVNCDLGSGYTPPPYNTINADLGVADGGRVSNRAITEMVYSLRNGASVVMPYHILFTYQAYVNMPYGVRLGASLVQYYSDAPLLQKISDQYYGNCPALQQISEQKYGDLLMLQKTTEMPYRILKPLQAIMQARYGLSGDALQAIMDQNYSLSEYNLLRKRLTQLYMLQEGSTLHHVTSSVLVAGNQVNPHHINIEYTKTSYVATCEIHLSDEAEFVQINKGDSIVASINNEDHELLVTEEPTRKRSGVANTNYIITGSSVAITLSTPWCDLLTCVFDADTAKNIFEALANPIPVDWQIVDFPVLADTLYANDEDKISVMRKITKSAGAIIQSNPDGSLRVVYSYPTAVNQWDSATAAYYLTDSANFVSQDETFRHNPGYNRYEVSNTSTPTDVLELKQDEYPSVKAVEVPWQDTDMTLEHSGGSGVSIPVYMGEVNETYPPLDEPAERVEFVAGFSNSTNPIYGGLTVTWVNEQLGAITYSEDGQLEAAVKTGPTDGYSLADIRYTTRYKLWRVDNGSESDVQYILRIKDDDEDSSKSCS